MSKKNKGLRFPFISIVMASSTIILLAPLTILSVVNYTTIENNLHILRILLLVSTFLSMLGYIYCAIGYHSKISRGDELKFRIHLEALNISFTTSLVFLFALIFVFLNFNPTLLNYLIIILAVIAIIAYIVGVEVVKRKYR